MKIRANLKKRQGGAVAIIVGVSLALLIGFLALVIDLGHLYIAKAGLQNAADAAALSGVKELDGTSGGVTAARDKAIEAAGRNMFFANSAQESVVISSSDIQFGASQNGPWADVGTAQASPSGMLFIKVDTASGNLTTWFAPIWNILTISTFGTAVAGPIMQDVAPLAVCALEASSPEYGFRRGVNYNIIEINNRYVGVGGFPSVPLFLNPVDIPPAACDPDHGSNSFMNPFVCTGVSSVNQVGAGYYVYVNTGATAAQNKALNSRFNDYNGSPCEMQTAPPDTNVKRYICTREGGGPNLGNCINNPPEGSPRDWMDSTPGSNIPTQQTMPIPSSGVVPVPNTFANYGVLWAYAKEVNHATSSVYGLADWPTLYPGGSAVPSAYPTLGTPYTQTSGNYFDPPTGGGAIFAKPNRRVVNMVLVDCPKKEQSEACGGMASYKVPTLGIASFFMTRDAGLPERLDVEFGGIVPATGIERKYRLFR